MDGREEEDNKSGSFRLSLIIQCNGSEYVSWEEEEKKRRTVARMGYMFAPKNHPDRPNAIATSDQRTIGTGMTQRTYLTLNRKNDAVRRGENNHTATGIQTNWP